MLTPVLTEIDDLVEAALVAYLTPWITAGLEPGDAPPLAGAQLLRGHRDEPQDNARPAIIVTCANLGGELASIGNYDADVQIRIEVSMDGQGMAALSRLKGALRGLLSPEERGEQVLAALRAQPGLGVTAYRFNAEQRTQEGRDRERRRHGSVLPYVFLVHSA